MLHNNPEKVIVFALTSFKGCFSLDWPYENIITMYKPQKGQPFIAHEDGPNSPFDHQRVISKLTFELGLLYYQQKRIILEPLPETPLDEGTGHAVPDVILYDKTAEETKIIIEVCQNNGQRNDLRKIIYLIEDNDYNYKTHEWLRYRKGDGGVATNSAVSEVMGIDMGPFL